MSVFWRDPLSNHSAAILHDADGDSLGRGMVQGGTKCGDGKVLALLAVPGGGGGEVLNHSTGICVGSGRNHDPVQDTKM